jgi:hypothetical protein
MPESDRDSYNQQVIAEAGSNAGTVGGYFADTPLLLLTTTGANTGHARTTPLAYQASAMSSLPRPAGLPVALIGTTTRT